MFFLKKNYISIETVFFLRFFSPPFLPTPIPISQNQIPWVVYWEDSGLNIK